MMQLELKALAENGNSLSSMKKDLKSQLQSLNPDEEDDYNALDYKKISSPPQS